MYLAEQLANCSRLQLKMHTFTCSDNTTAAATVLCNQKPNSAYHMVMIKYSCVCLQCQHTGTRVK